MRQPILFACVLALAGCVYPEPLDQNANFMARSTEPVFQFRADGTVWATSCLTRKPSSYGRSPSACVVDGVLGLQAVHAGDLVHPQQPGPAYAAPVADAAYDYLYGDGAADEPGAAPGGGEQPELIVPPGTPDGGEGGEPQEP